MGCEVTAVHGEVRLTAIDIPDRATSARCGARSQGLFVFIGADADTDWLPAEIARDNAATCSRATTCRSRAWWQRRDPFLLETSMPGVFACGDVRLSPVKRVAAAVGEGSMAIAFVHQFLRTAEH